MVAGGDVETPFAAGHRLLEAVAIREVAGDRLEAGGRQAARIAAGPKQHADGVLAGEQLMHKVRPDET